MYGLVHVARFGMDMLVDDATSPRSQATYRAAYKAGLLAAQYQVNRFLPELMVECLCLGILALLPIRSKKP